MARKRNAVEAASHRVAVLREIVGRERGRAEGNPQDTRYVEIGITEEGQSRDQARAQLAQVFDELAYLIDHLNIAHMAAAFEAAALERMKTVIGEARSAVERDRKGSDRWPGNLVRNLKSFEGLYDIGGVMALDAETVATFAAIREVRNKFGHAPNLDRPSAVTGGDALETLSEMLAKIR